MIQPQKNRQREKYTFANINLLGLCNANCYFCLGKDIPQELAGKNQLAVPFANWKNFEQFLARCQQEQVRKLFLTGQTADGLQYKFLDELIDALQGRGFEVGVRTNGYLAKKKLAAIQRMNGEIGYSIHTIRPETNHRIMGRKDLPDWETIIPASGSNVRVAIVLNRYNIGEFDEIVKYITKFPNVRYIQVRRISTDTRLPLLQEDMEVFENFYTQFAVTHEQDGKYFNAQRFQVNGKELVFWRTVETSVNSLNYFTDGTISDEYFIVEGYLKSKEN